MKNLIMSLASMTLCVPLWAQNRQPVEKYQATYSENERGCAGRVERKNENGGRKMEFTLSGPSDVSVYAISGDPKQFKEFYEDKIIAWLKQYDKTCDHNVYLLGEQFVVVVSSTTTPPPWEGPNGIPHIEDHIKKVDVATLKKPSTH